MKWCQTWKKRRIKLFGKWSVVRRKEEEEDQKEIRPCSRRRPAASAHWTFPPGCRHTNSSTSSSNSSRCSCRCRSTSTTWARTARRSSWGKERCSSSSARPTRTGGRWEREREREREREERERDRQQRQTVLKVVFHFLLWPARRRGQRKEENKISRVALKLRCSPC